MLHATTHYSTELFGSFQHPWWFNRPNHKERPQIQHSGSFSMHLNQRFLITCQDFRSVAGHPSPANSGLDLNRPIRSRISRKSVLGTTTSAIWNTTYRECLITLAPILMSFSLSVRKWYVHYLSPCSQTFPPRARAFFIKNT